jgi:hypothetical protein
LDKTNREERSVGEAGRDSSSTGALEPGSKTGFSAGNTVPWGTRIGTGKVRATAADAKSPADLGGAVGKGFPSFEYCFSRTSEKFPNPWGAFGTKLPSEGSGEIAMGKSRGSMVWSSL